MPAKPRPLRCPYCGDIVTVILAYTGGPYSEHRDLDGFECENLYDCGAEWDRRGNPTVPSKLPLGDEMGDDPASSHQPTRG